MVCHIRDEAHRFGITFHRQKRSKAFIHSELEQIPGIGNRTIQALLRRFRTVAAVRRASEEELAAVAGAARARKIRAWFDDPSPAENPSAENPSADPTENPNANLAENPAVNSVGNPF